MSSGWFLYVVLQNMLCGWTFNTTERRSGFGPDSAPSKRGINAVHTQTGMRLWGENEVFLRAEFSLPRMMSTTNNNLLETPEQLDEALSQASEIAAQVLGEPLAGKIVRIDLCAQFHGAASEWVLALRNAKHPKIRKPNRDFNGETLHIKGSELEFCFYDKGLEAGFPRDEVVRLELRLKVSRMIREYFDGDLSLSELEFDKCYSVFRVLFLGLSRVAYLHSGQTMTVAAVLLSAESMGYQDLVDKTLNAMSPSTRSRTKKKCSHVSRGRQGSTFLHFLPSAGPATSLHLA